jgi:hypothetical protein
MEFERYEDVIDAFERDNMGYETLTDYIRGNNIRIAEIDMSPMGDLAKAFNKKDGGMMIAIEQLGRGGITGGKTYHQYHDQFVPPDSESEMYANGGGVGSMMQPKKKNFKMQGGVRNYLGNQKQVKAPLKWQSSPDHPTTELAYITKKEKDLLVKSDLHGSLKGKVNRGPSGIISLNGFGSNDPGQNVGGGDISSAETGGGRSGMSQSDANDFRAAAINAGAGQRVNPGFFDSRTNLTKAELDLAKAYRNDPANIFANQAYKNTGQTGLRGFISGGGILGALVRGLGQKFGFGKKAGEATYDMSEFNNLRNIDGEVIDTTGLELDKGMFGFPVNTNVTNQKPKANIIGKNLNDFQLGNPGKYATADALTEANMADYQTSLVDEFTPGGIDRTNLYEDFVDNRDLISETATSPQFNTSLINEFGVKDRGTLDANQGLQFGSIPGTSDEFGLMNSDAAKAAAMSVMSNAFNQNVMPGTSDMGYPNKNMNFPDTGMLVADASKNNNLQTLENIINKDMFEKNLEPAIENQNQKNQRLEELQKELGIIT